jgi:hypothetical protein
MRDRYVVNIIDSRDSRFTNKGQIAEWIADYGVDSDFVRVRVRGCRLPHQISSSSTQARSLQAQQRPAVALRDDPLVAGIGPGSRWSDECVFGSVVG